MRHALCYSRSWRADTMPLTRVILWWCYYDAARAVERDVYCDIDYRLRDRH